MNMNQNNDISYGTVLDRFSYHFNLQHNKSIIFSGKYGIGKSTFLKRFLITERNVINIRLFPVNYAISSNENIFELIKVDILKQLYLNGLLELNSKETEKSIIATIKNAKNYVKKHPTRIVRHISKALSKLHPLFEVADAGAQGINALVEDFTKFEEKIHAKSKIEAKIIKDYLDNTEDEIGSYFEFNIISQIIKSTIEKAKSSNRIVVLLIDDLDRLDPEHIFRLLNIFSSHHDFDTQEHKFGFDKVILACDLENIEKIFRHKYGVQVDFEGYIDKFYSDEVFNFNNDDAIEHFVSDLKTNLDQGNLVLFRDLLKMFVHKKLLTVRQLRKFKIVSLPQKFILYSENLEHLKTYNFKEDKGPIHISNFQIYFDSDDVQFLYIYKFLSVIFGGRENMYKKLVEASKSTSNEFLIAPEHFKSIIILQELANREKHSYKLFFNDIQGANYRNDADYPEYKLNNSISVKLILNWSSKEKYDGRQSFFYNSNLAVFPRTSNELNNINSTVLLAAVLNIWNKIGKKYLNELNIAS